MFGKKNVLSANNTITIKNYRRVNVYVLDAITIIKGNFGGMRMEYQIIENGIVVGRFNYRESRDEAFETYFLCANRSGFKTERYWKWTVK